MESSPQEHQSLRSTLGQGNPLPPPPDEREAILALIEGDGALITSLKAEKLRRDGVVAENESRVAVARACLLVLEADLSRAREFNDYVQMIIAKGIKFTNFTELEAQSARRSPIERQSCVEALERTKISELATIFHAENLAMKVKAAEYVERASSAVQQRQQELQTATTLIIMSQRDLPRISSQIKELENSSMEKKFSLQAIWRVPDDVWVAIFAHSTGTSDVESRMNTSRIREEAGWYGALVISAVCRRWRTIATGCPRIWIKVVVVSTTFKNTTFSRLLHYLLMSRDMPKTLLIDTPKTLHDQHARQLLGMFNYFTPLKLIVCILEELDENSATTAILKHLPPPPVLWLLRDTVHHRLRFPQRAYFVAIPTSVGNVVQELVTESDKVSWSTESASRIQLCSYSMDWPLFTSFWPIDLFSPSSISTLSTLRFRTTPNLLYARPSQRVKLPMVRELHTPLKYLLSVISRRFTLPALASMTIVNAVDTTPGVYYAFKRWLTTTKIRSIICESMGELGQTDKLISDLHSLSSLELRGESVSLVLSSLALTKSPNCLPLVLPGSDTHYDRERAALSSLKRLTISSYRGDGEPIISFLHRWKGQDKSSPHLRTLNVTILADECPGLSLEVRKQIISLAERRDRCESSFL